MQGQLSREVKSELEHDYNADVCKKAVNHEFFIPAEIPQIRFKTKVSSCSDFHSDVMFWMKEVEMVDPVDERKSSQ